MNTQLPGTVNASLIYGLSDPWGIAISGNDLFVLKSDNESIGEYGLDGSTVNASLIYGLNDPMAIAITPEPSTIALAGLGAAMVAVREWRCPRRRSRDISS